MKKLLLATTTAILASASLITIAADDMKSGKGMMHGNMMQKMDTDGDGMLSKEEFMKGHETMFDRMKGENGKIAMNDMPMKCMGMMGRGGMMDHGKMMDQDGMKGHGQSQGHGGMMGGDGSAK
jgi:hypothetical protein